MSLVSIVNGKVWRCISLEELDKLTRCPFHSCRTTGCFLLLPNLTIMDLLAQISGCYSRSTGTKLFFRGFRKDPSQTSLPNHIDPFCSLRAKYVSLDGFGLSPKTPLTVAHTNKCSPLLSFLDFTDQWLNFDFVKSSWLGSGTVMLDVEVSAWYHCLLPWKLSSS